MKHAVVELEERLAGLGPDERGSRAEIDALNALGWAFVPLDHRRAADLFDRALALGEKLGYELGSARARFGGAWIDFFRADYGGALARAQENARILTELGGLEDRANLLLLEGMVHWSLGDFEIALDALHRCYDTAHECNYAFGKGWSLSSLGSVFAELGDLEKAVELQERAIKVFRDSDDVVAEGRATSGLGLVYFRKGRHEEALTMQTRSLELHRSVGSELSAARALNDLGLIHHARGDGEKARPCLEEALEIRERFENWPAVVTTLLALGKLENDLGRPELAEEIFLRAVDLSAKIATRPKLWQAHEGLSRSFELQDECRRALSHLRIAQKIKEEVQGEETRTKLKNLQVRHEVESAEREAELQRVKNVELAGALERLQQAQSQLVQSEKMAAVGNLVAGVAHELNSPVGSLASDMDVQRRAMHRLGDVLEAFAEDVRVQRSFEALRVSSENAERACRRITRLVKSLEVFAQLDHSEFRRADINECIESAVELVRAQWGHRVEWVTRLGKLPEIECHPGALNQSLLTLLVNAAEANASKVTVTTESWDDHVRVRVCDDGAGIPSEMWPKLFEIGFTHDGERVRMKSGLANVRATVEKHHGRIGVDSAVGKGTTFDIDLPVRQPTPS